MKLLPLLFAAAAFALFGSAASAATTTSADFRNPASLNITSAPLTTGLARVATPYYDALNLNLGDGLSVSVTATAYQNGDTSKVLADRVVYLSQVSTPLNAGLGVTSVSRTTGLFGEPYIWDNTRDGSIDIDSYLSTDNGHDALKLSFNREVTLNTLSLFYFGGDDRAVLIDAAGADKGKSISLANACFSCLETSNYTSSIGLRGTQFILLANDLVGAYGGGVAHTSEFRMAGFSATTYAAPVPEPETYALLLTGLGLIAGIARRRNSR